MSEPSFEPLWLLRRGDIVRRGGSVDPARFVRVRHGVWMSRARYESLDARLRYVATIHSCAVRASDGRPPTFVLDSAAAVWGLPRVGAWPRTVHVAAPEKQRAHHRAGLARHQGTWQPVTVDGLAVSTVARTVIDLARAHGLTAGVIAADHALRSRLCRPDELVDEAQRLPAGARGRRRARTCAQLADAASMSPGESLSRVQMFLLGLPRPRLQVPHRDPEGLIGCVDFEWDGLIGEFDGRVKYAVPEGAGAEEASRVLWREKLREDRLRRHKPVARWTWDVARDRASLGRLLLDHGLHPDRHAHWFD